MPSLLSEFTVYTILRPDQLAEIAASRRPAHLHETKRWVTAKQLFDQARADGETVPILYADAVHDCSKLIYRGEVTRLDVDAGGTSYTVTNLTRLRGHGHRTQELVLRSTGETIAEGFLRPYAVVRTPPFLPRAAPRMPLTLFSFGYWGSGAATSQLVDAIDAAERERGFDPPLWVDTRIRRSVRAVGFRDGAFAQLLGPRHVWMPDLGNARVPHGLPGIEIKRPAAALELLDRAIEQPTHRVIFFCACEHPKACHRREVGKLLVRAARSRGIVATVVEWPGDEPREVNVEIPHAIFRKIARGVLRTMPLPATMSLGEATAVPWGSRAVLRADGEELGILVGPAHFNAHGAYLPILPTDGGEPTLTRLDAAGRRYRSKYGYEPMS